LICTPAIAVDRFAKSQEAGADISMVDLEDSVSPLYKEEARVKAEGFFTRERISCSRRAIRINTVTDPEGLRDLLSLCTYDVMPDMVMLPKVESPRDLEIATKVLGSRYEHVDLLAIIETAKGLECLAEIAASSPRLTMLAFGSADYSFGIGAALSWEALYFARSRLVTAARANDLQVMDSALFDVADLDGLGAEAARAKAMGFSGKVAIHPSQVPIINMAFSPDSHELEQARKIVEASSATEGNICVVDGQMIGIPFIDAARRLLDEFSPV
jgi:citrate lyase subunit beta/citryl-CoA lyase/(S)-citramalyl-CoA lyase